MADGKVIDVGKKRKKLQPIRTKFKTYRTTEWMNNMRLVNVFLALTDMNMAVPTSYDMVIADLLRMLGEPHSPSGRWTCVTVNTGHSSGPGSHYNHVTYGIDPDGVPRATFLEPLPRKEVSRHMAARLKRAIPTAVTNHYALGYQRNGSSCGYYSGWWQLHCQGLVNSGSIPLEWSTPPKPPIGWEPVCCKLFTVFDMQAVLPGAVAKDIGLRPLFTEAMASGVFNQKVFFTAIDEYAAKLQKDIEQAAVSRLQEIFEEVI